MTEPYYEKDGITIYNADCRHVLPHLEPVDLVLTDPPFGVGSFVQTTGRLKGRGKNYGKRVDWNENTPDISVFEAIREISRHRIIWGANFFNCFEDNGGAIVWDKRQPMPNFSKCEVASCTHYKKTEMITFPWTNFDVSRQAESDHPCERPVSLYKWCIRYIPGDHETVLDPFMGSGTTLVAAKQLGRRAIGIEIDERYCEIAAERLRQGILKFDDQEAEVVRQ